MGFIRNAKRPGSAERAAIASAQQQQGLGQQLQGEITSQLLAILRGESPSMMAAFGPIRQTLESQFGRARENILGNTPIRGGQLGQSLANLEMSRASDIFGLESGIRRDAFNQALSAGFQLPQAAIGNFTNLAQLQSQRSMMGQQGAGQKAGQMKGAITMMALKGAGGCWIAAVLYGYNTEKLRLARQWIFFHWTGRIADSFRYFYFRYGERWASFIQRYPFFQKIIRPFFDWAITQERHYQER